MTYPNYSIHLGHMDIRKIILVRLDTMGRSRYWLANRAHTEGLANRETVFRYLRGDRDTSAKVAAGLLELLGLEIRPKAQGRRGTK